jgi:protein-disulfide isomerase
MNLGRTSDDFAPLASSKRWPWWVALVLCLVGLWLSVLLEQIHFRIHTQPEFHSFCAYDRRLNCDIVATSSYSVLFGVPVATWGIFGYLLAGLVALWGTLRRRSVLAAGCALVLSLAFVATSAVLGVVSAAFISAVCILCMATYGVNILLLVFALLAARGFGIRAALGAPWRALRAQTGRVVLVLALLAGAAVGMIVLYPSYWNRANAEARHQPTAPTLPNGVEPGGGHFLGAQNPVVTITEFSDYECPYCRQSHTQLRTLVERFPTRLRLVHRHYPLDQSCNLSLKGPMHQNACFAASIAECAGLQNRFWEANDYLFAEARRLHARPNSEIARDLGLDLVALESCLREQGPRSVAVDLEEGDRLDIQATPTFLIEGKTYMGNLPAWVLARLENPSSGIDGGVKAP